MSEIFKTVLALSLLGFVLTAVLLCLKPIAVKKFPAMWQYYVWVAVLFLMIVPVYKLIPKMEAQKVRFTYPNYIMQQENTAEIAEKPYIPKQTEALTESGNEAKAPKITTELLAYVWLLGAGIYMLTVISSYSIYLIRKRKKSLMLTENSLLDEVKKELKIKRYIKIRMSEDVKSPMLIGAFFPIIYIPCREISDENMKMVFLHELTHYKRRDLIVKWICIFVNAVHWFNPLAYLLCKNVSEACETACDAKVTKNMPDNEQKLYIKTILDLVE